MLDARYSISRHPASRIQNMSINLAKYQEVLKEAQFARSYGKVTQVVGLAIEARGLSVSVDECCYILPDLFGNPRTRRPEIRAKVVGFQDDKTFLMPLGEVRGICPGSAVMPIDSPLTIQVGEELLGRVTDALGSPIDGKGELKHGKRYPIHNNPPKPVQRQRIREPIVTGVRAIDGLLTCGKGQRIGIFAGSGVGKSMLLGMIARNTKADVNVIALIGERGREVRAFIEDDLAPQGLKRSVVIVATSDQPPLVRLHSAFVASAIAEYFRDQEKDVMLMMDSITRFAMAQREIGLAVGEPPATKGYPPSVFALLPKVLERAGTTDHRGSITGLYTVLVEGDDINEPIADAARSILDGHIVLSRELASQNHYPSIDILRSVSRLMMSVAEPDHKQAALRLRGVLAAYESAKDLIDIGAYVPGANPRTDHAIQHIDSVNQYLKQEVDEQSTFQETLSTLKDLLPDMSSDPRVRGEVEESSDTGSRQEQHFNPATQALEFPRTRGSDQNDSNLASPNSRGAQAE